MTKDPRITLPSGTPCIGTHTVIAPIAPLYREASRRSPLDTQLFIGQRFDVYGLQGRWAWGQARSPVKGSRRKDYVGYVAQKHLADIKTNPTHIVTALMAPMFSKPDIKSHVIQNIPLGGRVVSRGEDGLFIQIGAGGFVHTNHVRPVSSPPATQDFVDIAEKHMGIPYVWGGVSTSGLDCSGLVMTSLQALGIDAPRDADMQEKALGEQIILAAPFRGLKRGDLVFWKGHVGIMQTPGQLLHANAYHMSVATEPLRSAVKRIEKSGGGPITSIKRLRT